MLLVLLGQLIFTEVSERIRAATESPYTQLIEAYATAFTGAAPFERTGERTTDRNGSQP
ncbi:transposase [Arthrobacter sp. UYEF20]|uniref:transposase n=1 Tax=Arthrobacter sp. UYEF20 TaxID=1756363 RepID=UPI0033965AC0